MLGLSWVGSFLRMLLYERTLKINIANIQKSVILLSIFVVSVIPMSWLAPIEPIILPDELSRLEFCSNVSNISNTEKNTIKDTYNANMEYC